MHPFRLKHVTLCFRQRLMSPSRLAVTKRGGSADSSHVAKLGQLHWSDPFLGIHFPFPHTSSLLRSSHTSTPALYPISEREISSFLKSPIASQLCQKMNPCEGEISKSADSPAGRSLLPYPLGMKFFTSTANVSPTVLGRP